MTERATLRLDSGDEVPVEVIREDAERAEIVVRRTGPARQEPHPRGLIDAIDAHLASAKPHPAGSTDQALAADRQRLY